VLVEERREVIEVSDGSVEVGGGVDSSLMLSLGTIVFFASAGTLRISASRLVMTVGGI